MTITWDGTGANPQKFGGPWTEVSVASDQAAVFIDGGALLGTLRVGTHPITAQTAPFLGTLSPAAELYMVRTSPLSARFGSASAVPFQTPALSGKLRHFGEWRYQVSDPERFAQAAIGADPLDAAGKLIAGLFDACALEWMAGGFMTPLDLAANHEKFQQVLPAHMQTAVEAFGLTVLGLENFQADIEPVD